MLWCGLGCSVPFDGAGRLSPCKVLEAVPWLSSWSRFVALVESRPCNAFRWRCQRLLAVLALNQPASFVSASLSRWRKALRLSQFSLVGPVCSWFAALWIAAVQTGGGGAARSRDCVSLRWRQCHSSIHCLCLSFLMMVVHASMPFSASQVHL